MKPLKIPTVSALKEALFDCLDLRNGILHRGRTAQEFEAAIDSYILHCVGCDILVARSPSARTRSAWYREYYATRDLPATMAAWVAYDFDNYGGLMKAGGQEVEEACRRLSQQAGLNGHFTRYEFEDGSAMLVAGDEWGVESAKPRVARKPK